MRHLLTTFIILSVTACSLQSQQVHFDKSKIDRIDLLVGDSSVWNEWQNHQDSGLMVVDGDVYFVDSAGKALHKPMQQVTFTGAAKDSLLDLINSFRNTHSDLVNKGCILLLRHSVLCYSKGNSLIDKADICFDCESMTFADPKRQADLEQNEKSYQSLISLFESRNVYLYNAHEK